MVSPKRFLPPESEPWGRSVDQDIAQMKIDNAKALSETTNAFKAINSSMKLVSKQITDLTTLTNTLAVQQIQLTQSVADITALNSSRVSSEGNQMSLVSAVVPASWTVATSVSFNKPAWAVNAFVTVMGSATAFSNTAGGGLATVVGISGVNGPTVFGETSIPNEEVICVLAFNRTFVAGPTVTASVQWYNAYGIKPDASGAIRAAVSVLWSK